MLSCPGFQSTKPLISYFEDPQPNCEHFFNPMNDDIVTRIKETLTEAANANCDCCQRQCLQWLRDLGWQWIDVEGKTAVIRFGFNISDIRITIHNRPGMLSNCLSLKNELEAPSI